VQSSKPDEDRFVLTRRPHDRHLKVLVADQFPQLDEARRIGDDPIGGVVDRDIASWVVAQVRVSCLHSLHAIDDRRSTIDGMTLALAVVSRDPLVVRLAFARSCAANRRDAAPLSPGNGA